MHVSEKDDEKLSTSDKILKSNKIYFFKYIVNIILIFSMFYSFLGFLAELVFQLKARGGDRILKAAVQVIFKFFC